MRTTKQSARADTSTIVDIRLLVPTDPEDCFGQEWDLRQPECQRCHDQHGCALLVQHRLRDAVKTVEKERGPFLDQTRLVDYDLLKAKVQVGAELEQIVLWAQDNSVCPDAETVRHYVLSAIQEARLRVKGGVVCD